MDKSKSFDIPKTVVWDAWLQVRANKGASGVDNTTVEEYERDLKNNLFKLWNRMSSGSYFPKPVRSVLIPKSAGGMRELGIPCVEDRIAQTVLTLILEPKLERLFHKNSYGFRRGKSAHNAVEAAARECKRFNWVLDIDIEKFFDSVDHALLLKAVRKHETSGWMSLYVERWLRAPMQLAAGELVGRTKGTPQGGVASPLLANLFLHYVFDAWMDKHIPALPFERYVDDIIVHTGTKKQAEFVQALVAKRFEECGLKLHPVKTKIVFCKSHDRQDSHPIVKFDFLGFTFCPRMCKTKAEKIYVGFKPAISGKAQKAIRLECRQWKLHKFVFLSLAEVAKRIDPIVRGWFNYYSRFYGSLCRNTLACVNRQIVKWMRNKYVHYRNNKTRAHNALARIQQRNKDIFFHWKVGVTCT